MRKEEREKGINDVKALKMVKPRAELQGIFIKSLLVMLKNFYNRFHMIIIYEIQKFI